MRGGRGTGGGSGGDVAVAAAGLHSGSRGGAVRGMCVGIDAYGMLGLAGPGRRKDPGGIPGSTSTSWWRGVGGASSMVVVPRLSAASRRRW